MPARTAPFGVPPHSAPFPGLRSFEAEESLLFFGRETHTSELLDRLGDHRFVAVIGTSGTGKSSLVRAGLRPALDRGYLIDTSSHWRVITIRPGQTPLRVLSGALASVFPSLAHDSILASVNATSAGLSQVVARGDLSRQESLLVIVDQFEELFRFDRTRDERAEVGLFIRQLLAATSERDSPIYVVVTMRSEFLGHCAGITGLVEAFNRSQYLVPALTRDQRQEAIEGPLRVFGVPATPALVQRVLNDAGDDPGQLPVLQHVLLRSFVAWERAGTGGPLDLEHYSAVGGFDDALNSHGDEILNGLNADDRILTERLFRSLTVRQRGVALRRPRRLEQLYDIVGAASDDARRGVDRTVTLFANRDNSFLSLSGQPSQPESVVDITHESLMWRWRALRQWLQAEAHSAQWYGDLSRDVARFRTGAAGLWTDPQLATALSRSAEDGWNEAWASQYRSDDDPTFADVQAFLDESTRQQDERRREQARERERAVEFARAQRRARVLRGVLVLGAIVLAVVAYQLFRSARREADSRQLISQLQDTYKSAQDARTEIQQRLDSLLAQPASTRPASNEQEIEQLRQSLISAQAREKLAQDARDKLVSDSQLATTDRKGLLERIDSLQQQVTQRTSERDGLQTRVDALQKQVAANPPGPAGDLQAALRQLDDERSRNAGLTEVGKALETENAELRKTLASRPAGAAAAAGNGDYREAFRQGVKAYDLKDWKASQQYMLDAIRFQAAVKDVAKRVPIYGLRLENYAPQSYLAASYFETNDCAKAIEASAAADAESASSGVKSKLQAGRAQCAAKK